MLKKSNCTCLKKVIAHALKNNKIVGGWLDTETNKFYYDSVKVFKSKKEALIFAKENNQLAIFNLLKNEEIRL